MEQMNPANNAVPPTNAPQKRKRGRPRKDRSLNHAEKTPAPPGFVKVNGNRPRQVEAIQNAHDAMVGQAVSGVIEAAFDAGYLLNVRVGNSESTLRGVVFKPGHFVPISAENDVAPNVPMVRRSEMPIPTPSQRRGGKHARHRNVNELQTGNQLSIVANMGALKGKQVSPVATQAAYPELPRGNIVPVLLQPVSLPNGIPPPAPAAPHLASSIDKQVPPLALMGTQNEVNAFHEAEGKPRSLQLLGEVINGIQSPSKLIESQMENSEPSDKLSTKDTGSNAEIGVPNMNEPLSIDPLQAVHPSPNQSLSVDELVENDRTAKLSQLLQVVQENMTENQPSQVQQCESSSSDTLDERNPRDEDHIHPNNRSSASSA